MIQGFKVGHFTNQVDGTGATVVLCEEGAVGGVDVRGCAPGTRETDLMSGCKVVEKINAVCLSGGSAFGLEACDGVMQYLHQKNVGHFTGTHYVPIVSGAVIYDLDYKKFAHPTKQNGYEAYQNAKEQVEFGNIGVGTGATVGKVLGMDNCEKSGVGYFEMQLGKVKVGCIVAVNALGDIFDLDQGGKVVLGAKLNGEHINTSKFILQNTVANLPKGTNTTIGCVFTNAKINREQANKLAQLAQNGLVLSISPVHTMADGDTMFVLANGKENIDFNVLSVSVVEVVRKAVLSVTEVIK